MISRRRAVLVPLTVSAAALAGCRWGPESASEQVASGATPPPRDADQQLVDRAVTAISDTAAVVSSAIGQRPRLRQGLAGFSTLHEAHLRHLGAPAGEPAPESRPAPTMAAVLTAERKLQDTLVDLAGQSGSGQLARSLASMAAGVAQHLALVLKVDQ